jgi:hypothetical protein
MHEPAPFTFCIANTRRRTPCHIGVLQGKSVHRFMADGGKREPMFR